MHSPPPRPSRRIDHGSPDAAQRSTTRVKVSMLETLADKFDKTASTIVTLTRGPGARRSPHRRRAVSSCCLRRQAEERQAAMT